MEREFSGLRISWARPDATAPRSANRFLVPVAGTRRFYNNFRRFRDTQRSRPPAAAAPPGVRPVVRARCSGSASSEGRSALAPEGDPPAWGVLAGRFPAIGEGLTHTPRSEGAR